MIPRNKQFRHQRHDPNGSRPDREHLPDSDCIKCHTRHWFSGPKATPCPPRSAVVNERFEQSHLRRDTHANSLPMPERPCTYCGEHHWVTGPNRSACDSLARKNHSQNRKFQQRTDSSQSGTRRNRESFSPQRGGYDAVRGDSRARDDARRPAGRYTDRDQGRNEVDTYDQRRPSDYARTAAITRERIYIDDQGREVIERIIEAPYEPYPRALARPIVDDGRDKYGHVRDSGEYDRASHRHSDREAYRPERRRSVSPPRRNGKYSPPSPVPRTLREASNQPRGRYVEPYHNSENFRRDFDPRNEPRDYAVDYGHDRRQAHHSSARPAYHDEDRYATNKSYAPARNGRDMYDVRPGTDTGRYR